MILDDVADAQRLLSYCTNVHAGETVDEILADLASYALPLRRRFRQESAFALGLRLGEQAIQELEESPGSFERLALFFSEHGLIAYTLNAFPQGPFQSMKAKSDVYRPDWADSSRFAYTLGAARVLSRLLPPGTQFGTISTLPLGEHVDSNEPAAVFDVHARALAHLAHELAKLEVTTGARIQVCLEPEPLCLLETCSSALDFFHNHLFPAAHDLERIAELNGEEQVQRYLGLCLDTCHLAVAFEEPNYELERLVRAGIGVGKMQLSCALELRRPLDNAEGLDRLARYDEPRFRHQVATRNERFEIERFQDLPEFMEWIQKNPEKIDVARCHFHVPIHEAPVFPLHTTQSVLLEALNRQRICREILHLEVETYTFDVLPRTNHAPVGLVQDLEHELRFARAQLLGEVF